MFNTFLAIAAFILIVSAIVGYSLRCFGELFKTGVVLCVGVFVFMLMGGCSHVAKLINDKGYVSGSRVHYTIKDRGVQVTYPHLDPKPNRAEKCDGLLVDVEHRVWNEEQEMYLPVSREWYDCMGVGFK